VALAGHLGAEQAASLAADVLEQLRGTTDWDVASELTESLVALAGRLGAEQAAPLAADVLERLRGTTDPEIARALTESLAALAGHLGAEQAGADMARGLQDLSAASLAWAVSGDDGARWAALLAAAVPQGAVPASLGRLVAALRIPMAGGAATEVLLDALPARDPRVPGAAAGLRANMEWLRAAHPASDPFGLATCPPPPPWVEGAICPPLPSP